MAVSKVQSAQSFASTSSVAATFSAVTSGNGLFAILAVRGYGGTVSCADSQGNIYQQVVGFPSADGSSWTDLFSPQFNCAVYVFAAPIGATAGDTVTLTLTGTITYAVQLYLSLYECAGLGAFTKQGFGLHDSNPYGWYGANFPASGIAALIPSGVTNTGAAFALCFNIFSDGPSWAVDSGFTIDETVPGTDCNLVTATRMGVPTGPYNTNFTGYAPGDCLKAYILTVVGVSAFSASCASPPGGTVGASYYHAFSAASGTPPYTFTRTSGSLPTGLSLNSSTGVLSGTATAAGNYSFALTVTDSASGSVPITCSITILAVGWLIINEPSLGFTDRTGYLYKADKNNHDWSLELRQRGQATIPLWIPAGDSYAPTRGTPVYLYDQTVSLGYVLEWAGLIQDIQYRMENRAGDRVCTITAVSLESVFDTVYAEPVQYVNQTCGFIVADLFARFENGCPVTLGTIQPGATVNLFNAQLGDKLSDLFDQLATTSEFTWNVNPATQQLFFGLPSSIAAPFTLTNDLVLWDSIDWKVNGADYRNRQGIKLSYDAFTHSQENFLGSGQLSFTLMRPVEQVTNCWVTSSTCNSATASFSGQPSPGDTITIGPADGQWTPGTNWGLGGILVEGGYVFKVSVAGLGGSAGHEPDWASVTVLGDTIQDNFAIWINQGPAGLGTGTATYEFVAAAPAGIWQAGTAYALGAEIPAGAIVNTFGFIQEVTTAGTAGSTYPAFSTTTNGTTPDGTGTLVWTCRGPCLDNTQFGQIVIGATEAETVQNTADALNAAAPYGGTPATNGKGLTVSLPTWENSQGNAVSVTGTGFTFSQKAPGSGWVAQLSSTGTKFAWSAPNTSGGTSPQTSVGPNEGATISIAVFVLGTATSAPCLVYTPGSNVVSLATPLVAGTNLSVEYTRVDGDVIEVEQTPLVTALAAISHGTGKYQQMTDQSTQGLISTSAAAGLQLAQQIIAAFSATPEAFSFKTYMPGLCPGMTLPVALTSPTPAWIIALLNGDWVIEEIEAEFLIRSRAPTGPYGHYRHTIKSVNIQEIASFLDFWEQMGGGSSGGGSGSGLVATSGGSQSTSASQTGPADVEETPAGTMNGTNRVFTLSFTPAPSSLTLSLNGVAQDPSVDFTIAAATVTFTVAPKAADWMQAWYTH